MTRADDFKIRRTGAGLRARLSIAALALLGCSTAFAQFGGEPEPKPAPREGAPIDLTGTWVSIVTEDWRHRMMTPPKGDFESVPLNPAGEALANEWDPAADAAAGEVCKAYGAPGVTRLPGRMRISWQDSYTLQVEFDNGMQSRTLHFPRPPEEGSPPVAPRPPSGDRSLQGFSVARWKKQLDGSGFFARKGDDAWGPDTGGSLEVVTSQLLPGYLRKNGVPFSADASLTEYFDRIDLRSGGEWLIVSSIVEDPAYLRQRFVVSSQFKKEPDDSNWNPKPCSAE